MLNATHNKSFEWIFKKSVMPDGRMINMKFVNGGGFHIIGIFKELYFISSLRSYWRNTGLRIWILFRNEVCLLNFVISLWRMKNCLECSVICGNILLISNLRVSEFLGTFVNFRLILLMLMLNNDEQMDKCSWFDKEIRITLKFEWIYLLVKKL